MLFCLLILSGCKKEELNDVNKNLSNCEIDCLFFNGNIYSANNNLEYIDKIECILTANMGDRISNNDMEIFRLIDSTDSNGEFLIKSPKNINIPDFDYFKLTFKKENYFPREFYFDSTFIESITQLNNSDTIKIQTFFHPSGILNVNIKSDNSVENIEFCITVPNKADLYCSKFNNSSSIDTSYSLQVLSGKSLTTEIRFSKAGVYQVKAYSVYVPQGGIIELMVTL